MPSYSFDIQVSELRAAYVIVERKPSSSGTWTQVGSSIKVRPGQTYNFEDADFGVEDLPLDYRATTYTSDGTAGTPSSTLTNTGT